MYLEYIFKTLTKSILTKQTTQLKNWAEDLNKTLYKRYANDKEHRERGASSAPGEMQAEDLNGAASHAHKNAPVTGRATGTLARAPRLRGAAPPKPSLIPGDRPTPRSVPERNENGPRELLEASFLTAESWNHPR